MKNCEQSKSWRLPSDVKPAVTRTPLRIETLVRPTISMSQDDCGYWIQPLCEHASRNGEDAANDCRYVEGQGYEITLPEPAAGERSDN